MQEGQVLAVGGKLDVREDPGRAQQTLIAAQLSQQTNRTTLFKALGGGWRETSQ